MSIQAAEGRALAERLTAEGRQVPLLLGRHGQGGRHRAAVELAVARFGRLDVVRQRRRAAQPEDHQLTLDDFYAVVNVNLLGPALVAKYAVPVMERQGKGVICFTTSVAADIGFPGHGIYCASKAGAVALLRCLATDHSPKGVRFVAVSPGTIDTPMLAASCAGWDKPRESSMRRWRRRFPSSGWGSRATWPGRWPSW